MSEGPIASHGALGGLENHHGGAVSHPHAPSAQHKGSFAVPMFSPLDEDSPFASQSPNDAAPMPDMMATIQLMREMPTEPPPVPVAAPHADVLPPVVTYTEPIMPNQPIARAVQPPVERAPEAIPPPTAGMQNLTFFAKKKGGTIKNWKGRYWLFEPTGGLLSYFEDKERKIKKGHIDLSICTAIGPIRHDRVPHTLGLRTKDRLWVIAFDTADEMGRVQTALGSVVQGFLEAQDVPISAYGKIKRVFPTKKPSKSSGGSSSSNDKNGAFDHASSSSSSSATASNSAPSSQSLGVTSTPVLSSTNNSTTIIQHMDENSQRPPHTATSTAAAASANEKAALPKLNQNLSKIREYTGKEFTLECDMSIVRARLESDHPDRKEQPGDIIYDGFMSALAQKLQEICESPLYRDIINHKCSGRIAIRISDDERDKGYICPYTKLEQGVIVIVCHRSLLTANLVPHLGADLLDVLSIDEPLHICAIKDIEDHKQGVKSCLIRIQSNLGVTCQFECDYTEGYKTLLASNPTAAQACKMSWGEVIYKILDATTAYLLKIAADAAAKASLIASIPNKAIRITIVPTDELSRKSWLSTEGGIFNVLVNAAMFTPERPVTF